MSAAATILYRGRIIKPTTEPSGQTWWMYSFDPSTKFDTVDDAKAAVDRIVAAEEAETLRSKKLGRVR